MKKRTKIIIYTLIAVAFWLIAWELVALSVDLSFIIPSVKETLAALFALVLQTDFYITVLKSFVRIVLGFVLGVAVGFVLGALSYKSLFVKTFFSPIMSIFRSTPVASFIMILWFLLGGGLIPVFIAVLMVMPLVYQGTFNGLSSIDPNLIEVASIYRFSAIKKCKLLYLPSLTKFLLPTVITACGLAWKSGVAAEIITYTRNSIGAAIFDAKNNFDSANMFAWTFVVIFISLLIEFLMNKALGKVRKI